MSGHSVQYAKRIIRKEGDVNFLIPSEYSVKDQDIQGGTMLHIAWRGHNSEILEDLLNLGADFTIKNKHGDTALHCAFKKYSSGNDDHSKNQDHSHIETMLSAHIKFANPSNPCDKNGLSHFHIACMVNSTEVVDFFLLNGVDINQAIDNEARQSSGFTPLHCAVNCCSIETIEVLLKYGADKTIKNGHGMTPLHQLLNQKMELFEGEKIKEALENRVKAIDASIFLFLGNNFFDKVQIVDNTGLSSFHIACTMQDLSKVENLLGQVKDIDHCVKMESPVWPGYAALHFAAHCNNTRVIKLLHRRGANINVKNAKGLTALDICLKIGHVEDIYASVSLKPEFANILFSDNKTRLVNFLSAMQNITQLKDFLRDNVHDINMKLPNNSPLWPGCTPLHLAVIMYKKYEDPNNSYSHDESILEQINILLKGGAGVTRKDASGRTPLHHAFRENKNKVSFFLCFHHHSSVNPVDEDNLSHLHIACASDNHSLVKHLLSNDSVDVNVRYNGEKAVQNVEPGSTPLNCVRLDSYSYHDTCKQMLIKRGAKDFTSDNRYGANTLHSACDKGDVDAVQRLIELGADVNFASKDGLTPLYLASSRHFPRIVELLLQNGADLIARDDEGHTPLSRTFEKHNSWRWEASAKNVDSCRRLVFAMLKHHGELQRRLENETGITMLHIASHMLDVEEVRSQIGRGIDVNARVHDDSKIWPGCTSLHVLICKAEEGPSEEKNRKSKVANVITQLLLENGTDVTLANTHMDTPIHKSYKCLEDRSHMESLFKHQRDFRFSPINSDGLSHFHVAVSLNCVDAVQRFLEHGVNVNQPTDFLTFPSYGCYPLHAALDNLTKLSDVRVVRMLLIHGADVDLEDSSGESAIHKALHAGPFRLDLMENLLSLGADINSQDIYGRTPLETLLKDWYRYEGATAKDIQFFLQRGCRVNVYNPVTGKGYLGMGVYQDSKEDRNLLFEELIKAPDVAIANEMGRTVIHNVVAVHIQFRETEDMRPMIPTNDYVVLLERLQGFGLDVDHQDHAGQTALHIAAQFKNEKAILALLRVGADLNIADLEGKPAVFYAFAADVDYIFERQILKLEYFGLTVSQFHNDMSRSKYASIHNDSFHSEIDTAKSLAIGELPITLGDFLSESNAVVKYSRMSKPSRDVIDKYFESNCVQFKEIWSILKLQHRKAVKRFRLVETVSTMKDLVGFALPALCADNILRFLSIADLENVVVAISFTAMKDLLGFALPTLCVDNILRFLSIEDLKNVVAAINFKG